MSMIPDKRKSNAQFESSQASPVCPTGKGKTRIRMSVEQSCLRRGSAVARFLGWWVRIPPKAWMSVSCGLADRGLCDKLITRAQESYRAGCVPKGLLRHGKILRIGGMILTWEHRNTWRKLCPSATLSITNVTWSGLGLKRGLRGQRPATDRLSQGTAL